SILCMIIGGTLYVLWRPESLWMFSWFDVIGIGQAVSEARSWAAPLSHSFPAWVYFSLPQALWLLSGCLAIHALWQDWRSTSAQLWLTLFLGLALAGELGQLAKVIPGVYDTCDLALIFAAYFAAQAVGIACYSSASWGT